MFGKKMEHIDEHVLKIGSLRENDINKSCIYIRFINKNVPFSVIELTAFRCKFYFLSRNSFFLQFNTDCNTSCKIAGHNYGVHSAPIYMPCQALCLFAMNMLNWRGHWLPHRPVTFNNCFILLVFLF